MKKQKNLTKYYVLACLFDYVYDYVHAAAFSKEYISNFSFLSPIFMS